QLNAEAILGLKPSIIFAEDEPGAKKSLESLSESGLPIEFVPSSENLDRAYKLGKFIGQKLEVPEEKVEEIYKKIEKDSLNLVEVLEGTEGKPSVLFLYARGTERLMVAGKNTSADAVIGYAGGVNAVQAFDGFKILSPETLVESQPEIILMFKTGLASLDGKEGLSKLPGIAETPAMKNDRIIAMDGYFLLGFGPRQAEAVVELAQKIHKQKVTAYLDH
ncbi:MAG: ABC transporter substrate-binding protein, partial [Bacteroidota bacterium]